MRRAWSGLARRGVLACGLALLAAGARAAADEPRFVDYVYVEPNEGGSSGGHVALRFGSETFHFQQGDMALLRLRRDESAVFDFRYAMLGNRPLHDTSLAVSEDTYRRLHDAFTRRLFVRNAQADRLDALSGDVALFDLWLRRARDDDGAAASVPVPAAGYLLPDGFPAVAASGRSPAVAALRDRVASAYGADFVARRIAGLRAGLAAWRPRAAETPSPLLALDTYPSFATAASTAYAEQLSGLTALEVLTAAPALRAGSYRVADDAPSLDARERRALEAFAATLAGDLTALAASSRPDFGYPLLLGMARLAALESSLASGRWVVLDAFAADAPSAPLPSEPQRTQYLTALAAQLRPAVDRARNELVAQPTVREADYAQLESALNRLLEVSRGQREGTPLRIEGDVLLPTRPAQRSELVAPPLPEADSRAELARAHAALADYRARLAALYGYNLITRNCVSEVFATIDAALAGGADEDGAARQLGDLTRTGVDLDFIPFVSAAEVERSSAAVAERTHPSYRQLRIDALLAAEPAWRVYLRESNTLTSTVYHPGWADSAFLFFTDDSVALRPLLGTANLLVGIADGVLGLATWPADDGARLRAGWRGALFSLPELAFVNIRKGSMAWVDEGALSPADATAASPQRSSS
jgi:hypothetical protein